MKRKNAQSRKAESSAQVTKSKFIDQSAAAQRARLLDLLRIAPRTTTELRNRHAIMAPAPRVLELRRLGYDIALNWIEQYDAAGYPHRAGIYSLVCEA